MIKLGTNILSQTVQRNLGRATQDLSKASERLSSGQRINRASDDAAGLAISMSLDKDRILARTAQRNVSDGISMVSILSSGLSSQKEILFRMSELAEQSANGTYSPTQREGMQKEYSSLMDEFDRIADSTEFNGVKLLRNPTPQSISIMAGITGGASGDTSLLSIATANSHRYAGVQPIQLDVDKDNDYDFSDFFGVFDAVARDTFVYNPALHPSYIQQFGEVTNRVDSLQRGLNIKFVIANLEAVGASPVSNAPLKPTSAILLAYATNTLGQKVMGVGSTINYANDEVSNPGKTVSATFSFGDGSTGSITLDLSGLTLYNVTSQITEGPSAIGFTNIKSSYASRVALDTVKNRIDTLSSIEGQYGALVSRLNVAHNVLSAAGENFAAASSRIKDADIANEAATSVRSGILQQAASALLAQANQAPQIALSLLR